MNIPVFILHINTRKIYRFTVDQEDEDSHEKHQNRRKELCLDDSGVGEFEPFYDQSSRHGTD